MPDRKTFGPSVIHKHVVRASLATTELELPASAFPLLTAWQSPQMREDQIGVWWCVPVDSCGAPCSPTKRRFIVRGTGRDVPAGAKPIGSAICGQHVWHVFEVQ